MLIVTRDETGKSTKTHVKVRTYSKIHLSFIKTNISLIGASIFLCLLRTSKIK